MKFNKVKIHKLIKEVIEAEDDSMKPPKQLKRVPGVKVPLHKPKFPMDFILYKFPDIKRILNELLTVTFRDFIENIYVVAPKPTTMKIVLKNDQSFLLIYEERSYVIKAKGKKYYLLNLGEKQRAIKAIADLLATQKFTTNKKNSDEDVEESDSSSSGGSSGGGGGNFPGGDDSGGSEGGAEGGEGEGGEDLPPLPPELANGLDGGGEEGAPEGDKEPEELKEVNLRIKLK